LSTYETRKDGWPLCPQCGEDELYSLLHWDGLTERPPMQAWIDAGLRCYKCGWDDQPSIASISSAIAVALLQKRHDAGGDIEIPSLGITIPGKRVTE